MAHSVNLSTRSNPRTKNWTVSSKEIIFRDAGHQDGLNAKAITRRPHFDMDSPMPPLKGVCRILTATAVCRFH